MKKIITNSAEETKELARKIAKNLKKGSVIALYGDLGEGKTTFVQGLAEGLGLRERIISPTFVILRTYSLGVDKSFHHIDLYRIGDSDFENLGIYELFSEKNSVIAIEWADRLKKLPKNAKKVKIQSLRENKRRILIDNGL